MKKILFDTDVLIELLRGNPIIEQQIEELILAKSHLCFTPISISEIYKGIRSNERIKTKETLSVFDCINIDSEIGQKAGEWMKQYSKSHGLELPDAMIAAAATVHRFSLCTFNWKHYPMREVERFEMERK